MAADYGLTRLSQQGGMGGAKDSAEQQEEEPIWEIHNSLLDEDGGGRLHAENIEGVEGAFLVPDLLTDAECTRLLELSSRLGFSSGRTLVEVPTSVRQNDVSLLVPPVAMVTELARRLSPFVPCNGHGGGKRTDPDFINRRWRVYRYLPPGAAAANAAPGSAPDSTGSFFKPHYDAAQPRSGVANGELIDDEPPKGVVRLSQMSVLLYLTDGHRGGHTVFYPSGQAGEGKPGEEEEDGAPVVRIKVAPRKGAALVFWHGRHPLSPLHEGAPLEVSASSGTTLAPKVVIRIDVLFATEAPQANSNAWTSSNYVAAMLHASRLQADGH